VRKRYLHDCYGQDDAFWDQNWDGDWQQKCSTPPEVRHELIGTMMRHLKPGMRLLEGGCGDGRYVRHLSGLGIETVGVDFARATVEKINALFPELDVRVGDIRNLDFPDNHFDGYYSGGVIEHFEDGVDRQLAEACRVLKSGGYFFVTVPHMNLSRRWASAVMPTRRKIDLDGRISYHKERLREFRIDGPANDFHFHEYVFTTSEMRRFLTAHGFRIVEQRCFSAASGLCDIEPYRKLAKIACADRTILNKVFAVPLRCVRTIEGNPSPAGDVAGRMLAAVFGNMKLYVCRTEK